MKKALMFLGLTATFSALAFFGWGCQKQTNNAERKTNNVGQPKVAQTATSSQEVTPLEPQALAYLQLTEGAKVTVSRGTSQMQGVSDMELLSGDTVEVTVGEARLLYPETGVSVLEQGTKVTLVPDGEPKEGGIGLQLMMEAGKIWTRLERLLGSDESLSVEASTVVATVRGTGFGMRLVDGDVDVTVADHQVRVTTRTMLNTGKEISESVLLSAGNGLRLNPANISKMTDMRATLLKNIRKLTDAERKVPGFVFGTQRLLPDRIKRPVAPFRWSAPPILDQRWQSVLKPNLITRWQANTLWFQANQTQLQQAERVYLTNTSTMIRFVPPTEGINLLNVTPDSQPSVKGPSS